MLENSRLKNAVALDRKIAVYIPGTMGTAEEADNAEEVKRAAALLSAKFGGATIQDTRGAWVSDVCGLVEEKTTVVYAFCTAEALSIELDSIIDYMYQVKSNYAQEAVSLEVNGVLYLL